MESQKPDGNVQDLAQHLIHENILIRAQFTGLKTLLIMALHQGNSRIVPEEVNALYLKIVRDAAQTEFASNPWMEESWRNEIEDLLRDMPGIMLPSKGS